MKFFPHLFLSVALARNFTFPTHIIEQYGELSWGGFRNIYKQLNANMKRKLWEHFRVLKRDCFNHGKCRRWRNNNNARSGADTDKTIYKKNIPML